MPREAGSTRSDWRIGELCVVEIGPYSYAARVVGRGWWRARVTFYVPDRGVVTQRVPWASLRPYDGRNDG